MLLDKLFPGCSVESTEELQPSAADDGQCVVGLKAPNTEEGQAEADPVATTMEEMPAAEPVAPVMEEPPATGPTSPDGGAHDEGDPADMSGGEEAWTTAGSSGGPVRAGLEAAEDAPSSTVEGPPTAIEQATPVAESMAQMGLGRPVRAQQQPRRTPLRVAVVEVEEIVQEPAHRP
ncbi:uncharacterized protein [Miscanthus floridulus]|uniref:uncharacterized protein n=1 Tax=Miscanthus floridulus TaxID=154761 RepID=UPI00345949B1